MGEGRNRMIFKNSNVELDYIMKELLNNEAFLSRVAEKISRDYLRDKDNYSVNQELAVDNIENVKEEDKLWSQQVNVKQVENLNREKNEFDQKIEELIRENNRLLEERNILSQKVNSLKVNLDDITRESKQIIDMKDRQIADLKNKQSNIESNLYELKQRNESLKQDLAASESKYYQAEANMKHSLDIKDKELYNKEIELREKDKVILQQQSQINDLKSEFSSIKESYNLFLSLNDEIKEDMVSILRGDKIENFVYAGVQYKNIESIWEYAKNRAINGQLEDLDKLEKIIMNFLDAYNMTYNSPLYEVQRVENGDDFDEEKFIRGYESRITGVISGVDLLGYVNLINGKIIKKSVVRI